MKTILLALLLCFSMVAPVGCKTNTATATVKADKSVVAAANGTLDAWSDSWVARKRAATKAGDKQKLAELELEKVRVDAIWKRYQRDATAIVLAQKANYSNPTNTAAQITGSISAVTLPVIQLLNELIRK